MDNTGTTYLVLGEEVSYSFYKKFEGYICKISRLVGGGDGINAVCTCCDDELAEETKQEQLSFLNRIKSEE